MPQLNLNFIDIPIPETCLWEQFDDEQKRIVIETLTRLLVKLAQANNQQEQIQKGQNND
jgi:phenylpyruvate tautomerase PptA (4-oxalocrotonate tautomerase family)